MNFAQIEHAIGQAGLIDMGAFLAARTDAQGLDHGTLILVGTGAAFWQVFSSSPEATDGELDPIDRWSTRVIGKLANDFGARALFPFGGPPFAPFIDWALKSGRAFQSPTGMLVHDKVGLMISYRGALHFQHEFDDLPATPTQSPCESCTGKPCLVACPVKALSGNAPYDVTACHSYLDSQSGRDCMDFGCAVRRACPVSKGAARTPSQSSLHMKAFHPS